MRLQSMDESRPPWPQSTDNQTHELVAWAVAGARGLQGLHGPDERHERRGRAAGASGRP